ncbi:hypothetical protein [Streptomyces luteogriseus]|uniref:hypothetical protein n=1 Tax=Streptomyces luteogriseus TaxID=68233 RepID=UPI00382BF40D
MSSRTEPPVRVQGSVSIARLHGRACWYCGAVSRTLRPAGRAQRGAGRMWNIVSCGCHKAPTQTGGSDS